ncbi:hypothetical protein P280DRAFT_82536 [Massarina eburnea CBS 473.64]|uniref:Nucleoporin NSP1 n=1 Tax=Massarina eburnea CBS 473.64 TaxID=1395130 RepID=A0A6A6RVV6_9PLEO|nr:hypothetical protein P280DRAFT_82536 [Massarina eburnea CBS 473.64]
MHQVEVHGSPATSFAFNTGASTPAATPAPNKTSLLPSTTPAGPPPGNSVFGGQSMQAGTGGSSGSSLFSGAAKPASSAPTSNLFGLSTPNAGAANTTAGASGGSNLFGNFGKKDAPADANKSSPAPTGLFGGGSGGGAQSGAPGTQGTPKPSLFSLGSTTPSSTTPASKPPAFSLGGTPAAGQQPSSPLTLGSDKSTPATTGGQAKGLFPSFGGGTTSAAAPASGATTTSAPSGNSLFGNIGASKPMTSPGTPASSGGSLFPSLGSTATTAATSTPTAATSAPAPTTTASSGTPLFGGLGGLGGQTSAATTNPPATAASTPAPATGGAATTPGTAPGDASKNAMGSSTAGPAPSAQSRLKNKSMDEIITRWAADLSKYQKEFQQQAETVSKWDRNLVENSDKVKQLYAKTFQAERDAAEVERQLTMMEENQQELDTYLDRYEKEIDNLMKTHGVSGRTDGLRGPDQERERTYKLAEKLQDRLNELNKDLTEMIEEINNTSQTLSKTGKPDDPLTKVVRVLNTQLSQLQLIDSGAAQLQEKIEKAQKESQRGGTNGWHGLGTDPSDDFMRSYRGGRTDRFGGGVS